MENQWPPDDDEIYTHQPRTPKFGRTRKSGGKGKLFIALGVCLIVVLGGAAAAWYVMKRKNSTPVVAHSATNSAAQSATQPEPTAAETATTPTSADSAANAPHSTFKSTTLKIEISYRKDWTVKESADKSILTVTSPQTTYTAADGSSKKAAFTLKFHNGISQAMQTNLQKMTAPRDTVIVAYDSPTESQRHYTGVSYAGLNKGFNVLVVTGSMALKANDPYTNITLPSDIFLIAGGFGADAANDLTFDTTPVTVIDGPTVTEATNIIKSLKVF